MASKLTLKATEEAAAAAAATAKSSAEIVGSIDDLLREILRRLPLKPLVRFEVVSKHWHSVITNWNFLRLVISQQIPTPVGLMFSIRDIQGDNVVDYFPLSSEAVNKSTTIVPSLQKFNGVDGEDEKYEIMQSCNGLLLFVSCLDSGIVSYGVCNPTTNRFFTLPEIGSHEECLCWKYLAFEPTKSPYYKVFCIMELSSSGLSCEYQIYIYSSDTNRWRASGKPFTNQKRSFHNVVYWNGNIHWMESGEESYFDMENEMLKELPRLPIARRGSTYSYLGESSGHLHYVQILTKELKVYELKKDYSAWLTKYHIDLSTDSLTSAYTNMMWNFQDIICLCVVICGEDEKDSFLILGTLGNCIQYNLVSKTSKVLREPYGTPHNQRPHITYAHYKTGIFRLFQYVECICPVN